MTPEHRSSRLLTLTALAAISACTVPNPLVTQGNKFELELSSARGRVGSARRDVRDEDGDPASATFCVCPEDVALVERGSELTEGTDEYDEYKRIVADAETEALGRCDQIVDEEGFIFDPEDSTHVECAEALRFDFPQNMDSSCRILKTECNDFQGTTGSPEGTSGDMVSTGAEESTGAEDGGGPNDGGNAPGGEDTGGESTTGGGGGDNTSNSAGEFNRYAPDAFAVEEDIQGAAESTGGWGYAESTGAEEPEPLVIGPEDFGYDAWNEAVTSYWFGYVIELAPEFADQIRDDPTKLLFAGGSAVGFSEDPPGLVVFESSPDSLTAALGLRPGDRITWIGDRYVGNLEGAVDAFNAFDEGGETLNILYVRNGLPAQRFLVLP